MRARQIIVDGGFGPEDFAILEAAFSAAWEKIEARDGIGNGVDRNAARERLARIIVVLGKAHNLDAETLQTSAVAVFDQQH
jgi:hypothetical protein